MTSLLMMMILIVITICDIILHVINLICLVTIVSQVYQALIMRYNSTKEEWGNGSSSQAFESGSKRGKIEVGTYYDEHDRMSRCAK